ncbi:hypothetical protein [Helicobacter pylori]|uniref:hypothetical protein n=1 Tax=Helicobacter pylori TaxID=210 RepID=UPI001E2CEB26|nr:hypothetical protein [Helicobacter pylori]
MKKENKENNKIAVFFDCENVSAEHVDFVFKKLQNHGEGLSGNRLGIGSKKAPNLGIGNCMKSLL